MADAAGDQGRPRAERGRLTARVSFLALLLWTISPELPAQENAGSPAPPTGGSGNPVDTVTVRSPSRVRIRSFRGQDVRIIRRAAPGGQSGAGTETPAGPARPLRLSRQDLDEIEARIIRVIGNRTISSGRSPGGASADINLPGIRSAQPGTARVETVYVDRPVPLKDTSSAGPVADTPPVVPAAAETVTVPAPAPTVLIKEVERSILEKGLFTALDVIFEFNKSRLMPRSFVILNAIGSVLGEHPEIDIMIEGHTDSIGSAAYNLRLSEARAASTREYLLKNFPTIEPGRLVAMGFGLTRPVADNGNETGRALNRRVEFRVTENRGRR